MYFSWLLSLNSWICEFQLFSLHFVVIAVEQWKHLFCGFTETDLADHIRCGVSDVCSFYLLKLLFLDLQIQGLHQIHICCFCRYSAQCYCVFATRGKERGVDPCAVIPAATAHHDPGSLLQCWLEDDNIPGLLAFINLADFCDERHPLISPSYSLSRKEG